MHINVEPSAICASFLCRLRDSRRRTVIAQALNSLLQQGVCTLLIACRIVPAVDPGNLHGSIRVRCLRACRPGVYGTDNRRLRLRRDKAELIDIAHQGSCIATHEDCFDVPAGEGAIVVSRQTFKLGEVNIGVLLRRSVDIDSKAGGCTDNQVATFINKLHDGRVSFRATVGEGFHNNHLIVLQAQLLLAALHGLCHGLVPTAVCNGVVQQHTNLHLAVVRFARAAIIAAVLCGPNVSITLRCIGTLLVGLATTRKQAGYHSDHH